MNDGPVIQRRIRRRTLRNAIIIAITLVTVLLVGVGGIYFFKQHSQRAQEQQQAELDAVARGIADKIQITLKDITDKLDALVKDENIVSLFERGDAAVLVQKAVEMQAGFAQALKLRFLLPGGYEPDNVSSPPLSYASIALLKHAETTAGPLGAEVHMFGSPGEHIVIVRRVTGKGGDLVGLVHLALGVDLFGKILSELGPVTGYAELIQQVEGKPLVLGKLGNGAYRNGEPVVTGVNNSRWSVSYWGESMVPSASASDETRSPGTGLPVFAIIGLVLVIVAGISINILLKRRSKPDAPSSNIIYAGAVKAIMEGAHPGMEKLIPHLPKMGLDKPIKPLLTEGLVGDDITRIAKPVATQRAAPVAETNNEHSAPAPAVAGKPKPAPPAVAGKPKPAPPAVAGKPKPAAPAVAGKPKPAPPAVAAKPKPVPPAVAGKPKPATVDIPEPALQPSAGAVAGEVDPGIFRTYDIRGVVGKTLTLETVFKIGQAIGSEAHQRGQQGIVVGRDGRNSSPELAETLIKGLRATGRDVIDIGMIPTPVLYFATHFLDTGSGVMITGSHNPPDYNGLKIMLGGEALSGEHIQAIYKRIRNQEFTSGEGDLQVVDVAADYLRRVSEDIPVALGRSLKIVIDCGNGAAGNLAPQLFHALGHDVIELYCEVDGNFPNHHPDPSQPDNLADLINRVREEQADLGFAFDGDGDRLGVIDGNGNIIWPDRQLMLMAVDVLSRNPGAKIIFDVKCSRHLRAIIESNGGEALMWKTGHSLIKGKMKEVNAPLAGEMSGHIFFKERWYGFDDALYAAARLVEILMKSDGKPADVFAKLPEGIATPELRLAMAETAHAGFMRTLKEKTAFEGAEVISIDGLRVEYPDGWGLIRPSNTSPYLILRFEADDPDALARIKQIFRDAIHSVNPELQLPF